MVRNKQNTYIKKAFFAATKINKDGSHTTYLAPLAENLKKYKISKYVFREWMSNRNRRPCCKFPKKYIDYTVNAIYTKYLK